MKDYYQILGIPGNATQAEIRKTYYKLAHQYHPDKNPDAAQHQKFLEINEAYEILGDRQKREIYHYRWVNFHNPPKAEVYNSPTPQTSKWSQREPATSPPFTNHYQNYSRPNYQEYEPFLRRVCQMVLLITVVILLDYVLARPYPNETVLYYTAVKTKGRLITRIYTENTSFILPESFSLNTGQKIEVLKTPVFRKITKIKLPDQEWFVNRNTIYHKFLIVVLLQSGLAMAGLYQKFSWYNRMNFSTMAGLCTIVTFIIMGIS